MAALKGKKLLNFVADTHALLWWFTASPKISSKASEIFEKELSSALLRNWNYGHEVKLKRYHRFWPPVPRL
jgi:hypothetical protein